MAKRKGIKLAFLSGIAKDIEKTDFSKVSIKEVKVFLPLPNSNSVLSFEDEFGRSPQGVPFTSVKEAEAWVKSWIHKEADKLTSTAQSYKEGLRAVLENITVITDSEDDEA
jgi:hypothetical protein